MTTGEELRVQNQGVSREFGAAPWQFDTKEYLAAVACAQGSRFALIGLKIRASWGEAQTTAMRTHGFAIAEERLTDELLQDLAR